MPRRLQILAAALLVPVLAYIDYATGKELNFFIFYFAPIGLAAWYVGRSSGLVAAFACAAAWYVVDASGHHAYTHPWLGVWFEEFLQRNLQIRVSHGISEEGLAQLKAEMERSEDPDLQ